MPSSQTSRPTVAHEHIFLLQKSGDATYWTHRDLAGTRVEPRPDYRWTDALNNGAETAQEPEGWREELLADGKTKRWSRMNLWRGHDCYYDADAVRKGHIDNWYSRASTWRNGNAKQQMRGDTYHAFGEAKPFSNPPNPAGRNLRTTDFFLDSLEAAIADSEAEVARLKQFRETGGVLQDEEGLPLAFMVNTQAFLLAHFATFPEALIRPMVLAGSAAQSCSECGAPQERVTEKGEPSKETTRGQQSWTAVTGQRDSRGGLPQRENITLGFRPTCTCASSAETVPSLVLDPFGGAGTTPVVAAKHGRRAIMVDASAEYCEMAKQRIEKATAQLRLEIGDD